MTNENTWASHWAQPQPATTQSPNPPATNGAWSNPKPSNPWDALSQDELLTKHLALKEQLSKLKDNELTLRKYIVDRAFPAKEEGVNNLDLGNGYTLKANVKFNYKLLGNDVVEKTLDKISLIGNQGSFIAERLVNWSASFLLTEYRNLCAAAEAGSQEAQQILATVGEMLVIEDAAPTLEVKEPKVKK